MKTIRIFLLALSSLLMLWVPQGHAEDIDIYADTAGNQGAPNVLFILDNAANFESNAASTCAYVAHTYADIGVTPGGGDPVVPSTAPSLGTSAGAIEQCALFNVVYGLTPGAIRLGLMVYNANNIRDVDNLNCSGPEGGCLAQPLADMTGTAKKNFLRWVKSWRTTGGAGDGYIKANGEATGSVMQEAWAYYAGKKGLSGRSYSGVQPPAGCQKNYVIFIGNAFTVSGTPGDGGSASPKDALLGTLAGANATMNASPPATNPGQTATITIPSGAYGTASFSCGSYTMPSHTDSSGLYADEWARYMKGSDIYGDIAGSQSITTYAVGLLGPACKPDYPALLNSMANVGGGKYFATSDYAELSTVIGKILNEIQAVNSVFASASLPVSVNNEGIFLNQIFLGMFRPDASAAPRWLGNLKQYQLVRTTATGPLVLGDADGAAAISTAGTGFITPGARSIWTYKDETVAPDLTGGFFLNQPQGSGTTFDSADGQLVEKGGAAQQLRKSILSTNYASTPSGPRNLYTYCPSGSSCDGDLTATANAFSTSNTAITDAMLGASAGQSATIARTGTTATVTATNHGFTSGSTVSISGANESEYNGPKSSVVTIDANRFTFAVAESPPTTALGGYAVSIPGAPVLVTGIDRVGSVATVNMPGHGFADGQLVTITGASVGYNKVAVSITKIDNDFFSYAVTEGPSTPAGLGTVKKLGYATVRSIESHTANPDPGVQRTVLTVEVKTTANHGFGANGTTFTIETMAGIKDAVGADIDAYNLSNVTGTIISNKTFRFTLPSTTPASPATGTIYADGSAADNTVTSVTRSGLTVRVVTTNKHLFSPGTVVNMGGTAGTNEAAYIGAKKVTNVVDDFTFEYELLASQITPVSPGTGTIIVKGPGESTREDLINWVRGHDNFGDEKSPGSGYTVRPTVHGDVLHSKPLVINYGNSDIAKGAVDPRGLVVFYGGNDGVFRAVNGSKTESIGSTPPGGELWGLVLPDHYKQLNRQRVNAPELKLPTTPALVPPAAPKDYFADGITGVLQGIASDGITTDRAILYLTMRRGGRFIYALDVTEPTKPLFLWKKSSGDAGYGELGQTWSAPRVTLVKGYKDLGGILKPVLVFGAGYDNVAEDAQPPGASTMGRGIFILDAYTGAIVWKASYGASDFCNTVAAAAYCTVPEMKYSVPGDIFFLDRDGDGLTDRMYFGDVGGNVWRVDLITSSDGTTTNAASSPEFWRVTKLAAVGCDPSTDVGTSGVCPIGTAPRKFFFAPAVIEVGKAGQAGSYEAVVIASGDREHPLIDTNAANDDSAHYVKNRFYMIKDTVTSATPQRLGINTSAIAGITVRTEETLFKGFKSAALSNYQRVVLDVMTVTTSANHGFVPGQTVVIDAANPVFLDGHHTISSTPTTTTFTFSSAGAAGSIAAATGQATVLNHKTAAITKYQMVNDNRMTLTTFAPHGFLQGQQVDVTGTNSGLDAQFTISSVPSATTFVFRFPGTATATSTAASGNATVSAFSRASAEPGYYGYLGLGEKTVNAVSVVGRTAFFGTNRPVAPSANTCTSNLGEARGYAVDPFGGGSTTVVYDGGGLPPTAVSGLVLVDGEKEFFCIGCGGARPRPGDPPGGADSSLENFESFPDVPRNPKRTYWYKK